MTWIVAGQTIRNITTQQMVADSMYKMKVLKNGVAFVNIRVMLNGNGSLEHAQRFNDILGTSAWIDWLPDDDSDGELSEATCLAAISNFYTASGSAACVQNHGFGVIGLPARNMDRVAIISETAFSEEDILSVVHSWAVLVDDHFCNKNYDSGSGGLGGAFRRTLCADIIGLGHESIGATTRRIDIDDHGQIATWCLQGTDSETRLCLDRLFYDLGDLDSYIPPKPISPGIDITIRSATVRRTFFITDRGYIGLGPAKIHVGDHVYILLGGQTPFILREAGSRNVPRIPSRRRLGYVERNCFEVIGGSYIHGLMDGEAMPEWRKVAGETFTKEDTVLRGFVNRWQAQLEIWERCSTELFAWKRGTDKDVIWEKVRDHARRNGNYDLSRVEEGLEKMSELSSNWNAEDEWARLSTSDLFIWRSQFDLMLGSNRIASLIIAAKLKVLQIENEIKDAEHKMDQIMGLIEERDRDIEQKGFVYLV